MPKVKNKFNKRYLVVAIIFVIGLYVLLPQLGDFKSSRQLLSHPEMPQLGAAVIFVLLTYLAAAGTYYFLAFKKLNYWRTVLVELAAMFVNRLLPGGVGALGANYLYLKRNHNNAAQASTIVAINNALGFVGHAMLSFLVIAVYSGNMVSLDKQESNAWSSVIKYVVIGVIIAAIALMIFGHSRFKKFTIGIGKQLISYKRQPWKLLLALLTSVLLTLCNVLCLYFSMQSIGVDLSFLAVFLIFSFAVSAGTITPTPGGLGGYEAALVAGFAAYDVPATTALAVALFYRLISYWLPLIIGSVAFAASQKLRYI